MSALTGCVYISLVVLWTASNTIRGQTCDCRIPGNCNPPRLCYPDSQPCYRENVALGKPTKISTDNAPPCRAVDGIIPMSGDADCFAAESAIGDYSAWLNVDLGQDYTITDITIYKRKLWSARMSDVQVKVDGHLCYTFPSHVELYNLNNLPVRMDIQCAAPLTGRVVSLQKVNTDRTDDYQTHLISVCEVQVWGCVSGYYRADCAPCGHCAAESTCNIVTGFCPNRCTPGWQGPFCLQPCDDGMYGDQCMKRCGQCRYSYCDKDSGRCPQEVCQDGWQRPSCQSCASGYFGDNCTACGNCQDGNTCDSTTGRCLSGCKAGWQGKRCLQPCNSGTYGPDCTHQCRHCIEGSTCNTVTGQCPRGCQTGWTGPLCDQPCGDETYGPDCANQCGQCAGGSTCNKTHGDCPAECQQGWNGTRCDQNVATASPIDVEEEVDKLAYIIGPAAGGFVLVLTVVIIIVLVVRRRRRSPRSNKLLNNTKDACTDVTTVAEQETELNGSPLSFAPSQAAIPPTSAQKTGTKPQVAVKPTVITQKKENGNDAHIYMNQGQLPSSSAKASTSTDQDSPTPRVPQSGNTENGNTAPENQPVAGHADDSNRVELLDGYTKDGATDFVNASYISGYNPAKTYIATQGPRDNTVVDLWRMVWQEKITHIVMLTNVIEAGKTKCHEYWPDTKKSQTHGVIKVTGLDVETRANYIIRTFRLKSSIARKDRDVVQYHYVTWPDHDVPTTTSLIMFWRFVMARTAHRTPRVPILVHCSAGVGRTGTFIGLDIGFQMAVTEVKSDVTEIVKRMRNDRCWLVQAPEQFVFLHKALLEAYTARDTFFKSMGDFAASFSKPISVYSSHPHLDKEFKTLIQMQSSAQKMTHDLAEDADNIAKNRDPDILPPDDHIVELSESVSDRNSYINAVYMSTFWHNRGCIVTQLPLPDTLVDFWRMMYGEHVQTVVSLADRAEDEHVKPYCWYWPRSTGEVIQTGPYTVHLQSKSQIGDRITFYALKLEKQGVTSGSRTVRVLRYEDWTEEVPANTSDLLHLVQALDNTHSGGTDDTRTGGKHNQPVVIQCSDGVSKCGLFCAICDVIHRMTCDREIDVYMAVRHLQSIIPQAVTSETQYRYLYDLVQRQAGEMSVYLNT